MINPTTEDIGRKVVYLPKEEVGVITSFNESGVFVRYGDATGSQHTRREDLQFEIRC